MKDLFFVKVSCTRDDYLSEAPYLLDFCPVKQFCWFLNLLKNIQSVKVL